MTKHSKKLRNRRDFAVTQDFRSFPSDEVYDKFAGRPFRSNVKNFIAQFACTTSSQSDINATLSCFLKWRIPFRVLLKNEDFISIDMDIFEEDSANSDSPFCHHCRVVGWSKHPVCTKRYHFIIRNDDIIRKNKHFALENRYIDEDGSHLVHGMIHNNGYGHLVALNGREGGSKNLSGSEIMSFWDRVCKLLGVRKISVLDKSEKYGVAYRSLHAITRGFPWYSLWGYGFGIGGFTITEDQYNNAIDILSSKPLSDFFFRLSRYSLKRSRLLDVISSYCALSHKKLNTVRDLFCFVLDLINKARKTNIQVEDSTAKDEEPPLDPHYTMEDIKFVEVAIFRVMMLVDECKWIRYHDLKKALYNIASPDVIDYCLKRLKQKVFDDGSVVATLYNADTNSVEFRRCQDRSAFKKYSGKPSLENLVRDLKFLFDSILNPNTMDDRIGSADYATRILDCKIFIKDYGIATENDDDADRFLHICCNLEFSCKKNSAYICPPSESLVLHNTATVGDLKLAALNAFREVYIVFKSLRIERLVEHENIDDSVHVQLLLGNNATVTVRGKCPVDYGGLGKFLMERGEKNWIVDCICGAQDDDGEEMISCDSCHVWKHTRCLGVNDSSHAGFVCSACADSSRK